MSDRSDRQTRLEELLEQWEEAQESGKPVSVAQLCTDCPELAGELEGRIEWQRKMDCLATSMQPRSDPQAEKDTDHSRADDSKPAMSALEAAVAPTLESGPRPPSQPAGWPTIAGFEILGLLGEGGMGAVYRAREIQFDRLVALKVIRGGLATPEQMARFDAEAKAVAQLQHPNIVQLFSGGRWQPAEGGSPLPYLAFELIEGGDLEAYAGSRPMPPKEAARLVQTLALAMDHAHRRGIIHRDLKPANVLMSGQGHAADGEKPAIAALASPHAPPATTPKVADFGLARRQNPGSKLTQTGAVMGTAAYMSPEQAEGLEAGAATDIYALGGILYRLLTGRVPFAGKSVVDVLYRVCNHPPEKLRKLAPEVPAVLEAVCLRCLEKKPSDRYPDAAALAADLEQFLGGPQTTIALAELPIRRKALLSASAWLDRGSERADKGLRIGCSIGLTAMIAALVVGGWSLFDRQPGEERRNPVTAAKVDSPRATVPEMPVIDSPLRLYPLSVDYIRLSPDKKQAEKPVRMGDDVAAARFDDAVTVALTLDQPLYCYVLAFAANGEEMLLYPADEQGSALPNVAPQQVEKLPVVPLGGNQFRLNEEPEGGLQVFVLLASRQPLPAYQEWLKLRKPVTWKRYADVQGVWRADDAGAYPASGGRGRSRDVQPAVGEKPIAPPLAKLCQELKSGGVEAVEAIAFPVLPAGK